MLAAEAVQHRRQAQPDRHEQQPVQQEGEDLPDRVALQPRLDGRQLRRVPAHVDARRDHRQHARRAQQVGRDEREIAGQKRDRDLERRVVQPQAHLPDHPSQRQADADAADHRPDERQGRAGHADRAGDDGQHGELVEHQRRPVVDQSLALDDRDDPARNTEPLGDRGGGQRIGGRDHRAQHERRRPRQPVDGRVRDPGNARGGAQHQAGREQADRALVGTQVAQRREERRRVEQRRQDAEQHHLRRDLDLGHARGKAEREAAQHQQDRVGHAQPRRGRKQRRERDQQRQRDGQIVIRDRHCRSV